MKYLRKFDSHTDYAAVESGFTLPNVSLCEQEDEVHYKPIPGPTTVTIINSEWVPRPMSMMD